MARDERQAMTSERLRELHEMAAQPWTGAALLDEALAEVERLRAERTTPVAGDEQAMSDERLAELREHLSDVRDEMDNGWPLPDDVDDDTLMSLVQLQSEHMDDLTELLAEVERLRAALDMRRGCVWSAPERREPRRSLCG